MQSEKLTQTFNGQVEWGVPGGYFKLLASVTPVDVKLYKGGRLVLQADDAEGGYYQRIEFDRVTISTPVSQEVSWLYAPAEGGSDRLAGEVAVVDGGKARTIANQAFMGRAVRGAVVGQYSHVQLLNPAASGKRLVLKMVGGSGGTARGQELIRYDTALTLVGNAPSKLVGGADSVAELREATNAAQLGTGSVLWQQTIQANVQPPHLVLAEPIVLEPGKGLLLRANVVNDTQVGCFEFLEEDDQ